MRKNILFNTTRQWNPGDQIIMLGLLRLLRHLDFNILIYNRHPNMWGRGVDNSYRPADHSLKNVDYYITAGTPEWAVKQLQPLFKALVEAKTPHSFIGVGCSSTDEVFDFQTLLTLLETSDLLTARDREAWRTIAPFGGKLLPCTGFFCGDLPTEVRRKVKTVGLIFMTAGGAHKGLTPRLERELIEGYKAVISKHKSIIICHCIDDALQARNHFPNTKVYYSYDAKDFESFYSLCDLVIGPRLHGVLLSAGLGIPSYITRAYDPAGETRRLGALKPLDIPSLLPNDPLAFLDAIETIDIQEESKRLINLRYANEALYLEMFCASMTSLYDSAYLQNKAREGVRSLLKARRQFHG